MLTTSAYGEPTAPRTSSAPPTCSAGGRACQGRDVDRRDVRLAHLQRPPAPAQQGARARGAGRGLAAVRALARAARCARVRSFDCVITSSPPESAHAIGMALRRRGVPWVADVRDGWTFEPLRPRFPTAAQRRLDEWLERRWLGAADAVVCVAEPAAEDLRRRGIAEPLLVTNGWDPESAPGARVRRPACSIPTGSRSSTRAASAATAATRGPLVAGARRSSPATDPDGGGAARAGDRRPADRRRGRAVRHRRRARRGSSTPAASSATAALALQREADALLLLAQPTRSQLLNIKVFEYLASRPPDPRARRRDRGRAGRHRGRRRGRRAPTTQARSRGARRASPPASSSRRRPTPSPRTPIPAPAQRLAAAVELAIAEHDSR